MKKFYSLLAALTLLFSSTLLNAQVFCDTIPFNVEPDGAGWIENGYFMEIFDDWDWNGDEPGVQDTGIYLFPGQINIDLAAQGFSLTRVEVVVEDFCGIGCTGIAVVSEFNFLGGDSNETSFSGPEVLAVDLPPNNQATQLLIGSNEALILEVRIKYELIIPPPDSLCEMSIPFNEPPSTSGWFENCYEMYLDGSWDWPCFSWPNLQDTGLCLFPGALIVDLTDRDLTFEAFDIAVEDNCGIGCTEAFAFYQGVVVAYDSNAVSFGQLDTLHLDVMNIADVDSLVISSSEGTILDIRLNFKKQTDCPDSLQLQDTIPEGFYQASSVVIASGLIQEGSNTSIQAGNEVHLLAGFHAQAGSNTNIYIAQCTSTLKHPEEEVATIDRNWRKPTSNSRTIEKNNSLQVQPNPFRSGTTAFFQLAEPSPVRLELFDMAGRSLGLVLDRQVLEAGTYEEQIRLDGMEEGVYFLVLNTNKGSEVKKLVLIN